jgi:hypothetical protein
MQTFVLIDDIIQIQLCIALNTGKDMGRKMHCERMMHAEHLLVHLEHMAHGALVVGVHGAAVSAERKKNFELVMHSELIEAARVVHGAHRAYGACTQSTWCTR